jgi:hypothetical protein
MRTLAIALTLAAGSFELAANETSLAIPGRANSTPWIAANGADVAIAWGAAADGKADIFVATSRDGGRTFGAPVRVNDVVGEARLNGEIAPRVTLEPRKGAAPIISVTWNAKEASTTGVKTATSTDGGRSFGKSTRINAEGAPGERGWQAAVIDARGIRHTIWLDHRAMAADKPSGQHKGEHDGVAMAQKSSLYYSAGGAERELFKGVCFCCKTAMALGANGELYAAWRHVFAGNMRDMAFTVSRDGGKTFAPMTRINEDGWSIQGCPDDGPAMAVDAKGTVHVVWPTVQHERGVMQYSTTRDGSRFTPPVQIKTLGGTRPSHPQVAVATGGRVFHAWDEVREGVRRAAIMPADGSSPAQVLGDHTSYPMIAASSAGLVVAWTSGPRDRSTIGVRVVQ